MICDRYLGGTLKDRPLTFISAMVANEVGLAAFQLFIRDTFLPFEPAPFHQLIPRFRWRAIATTNFDLVVERAYARTADRLQNLVKTVKDGDSFDIRQNRESNPVGFYKLHGCIDHYADSEIPLILGSEQYASYEANRTRFYSRFRDLGYEYPVVFAGYSISDPHIQRILFDLTDPAIGRPPFYMVSPGVSQVEVRYGLHTGSSLLMPHWPISFLRLTGPFLRWRGLFPSLWAVGRSRFERTIALWMPTSR
jgi:hypothetical protein